MMMRRDHTEGGCRTWQPRVGLIAPIKEEARYLLEWIAYHRALGIEHFFLADNGGGDGTSDLLQILHDVGLVQTFDWRGVKPVQCPFYIKILQDVAGAVDICSLTDVDEFLRPLNSSGNIRDAVAEIFSTPDVSAAALSWVTYGSSGRIEPGEGLVIERFKRRASDDFYIHRGVKSLVRPERFAGIINPHLVKITSGRYVNDHGDNAVWTNEPASTNFASWNCLRVDHFVLKSRREFEAKARRGRADHAPGVGVRDDIFFTSRDRNEVYDPIPNDFVQRTKTELAKIRRQLAGYILPACAVSW